MAARDRVGRAAEVTGGSTAAGVGVALGGVKLRDEYRLEHPKPYAAHAATVERKVSTVAPKAAGRLTRVLSEGRPGFTPLAIGAGGAALATAATHYRKHREKHAANERTKAALHAEVAKGLLHRKNKGTLARVGAASDQVAILRHKIVPSGLDIVRTVDTKVEAKVADTSARVSKAFDPDTSTRRKERVAETGLATGTVVAGGKSVQAVNHARGHLSQASTHAAARDRSLLTARKGTASAAKVSRAHVLLREKHHGAGVTNASLRTVAADSISANHHMGRLITHHDSALHSGARAAGALRHAGRLGVATAGLGAVTYGVHRRASSHNR